MTRTDPSKLGQPFPLKRKFRRWFIPAFIGFIGVFLFLIGLTANQVIESIYLEQAQRRAQSISRAVVDIAPAAWSSMMTRETLTESQIASYRSDLREAFAGEVSAMNLFELKVYNLDREVLFATHKDEIGTTENGAALRGVIEHATPEIATKITADGSKLYELYVPVFSDEGDLRTVYELYEPAGYLDDILFNAAIPILTIPGLLLLFLAVALDRTVGRAQSDINLRSNAINELRERIESFVSSTAVSAAISADGSGSIASQNITTALLFSDIRDFTGFSEDNSPEVVVRFLNEIMTLQVEVVKRHNGDIDKMIGDALLARFDGEGGGKRAVMAAREILDTVKQGSYPRELGIGVHYGSVISGAIGPADRRDFTVIGDTVNVAARLCAAAKAGEVVVEQTLADSDFDATERIQVKGRNEHLSIRRWKA